MNKPLKIILLVIGIGYLVSQLIELGSELKFYFYSYVSKATVISAETKQIKGTAYRFDYLLSYDRDWTVDTLEHAHWGSYILKELPSEEQLKTFKFWVRYIPQQYAPKFKNTERVYVSQEKSTIDWFYITQPLGRILFLLIGSFLMYVYGRRRKEE